MLKQLSVAWVILVLASCAHVEVSSIDASGHAALGPTGLRVPRMAPYLMVTAGEAPKVVYLPDWSHQQAISATPGLLGSATLQATLGDGGALTGLNGGSDNTEALKNATTLAEAAVKGTPATVTRKVGALAPSTLRPGIYRFQYGADGAMIGLELVKGF
jgi:hypothetical protein